MCDAIYILYFLNIPLFFQRLLIMQLLYKSLISAICAKHNAFALAHKTANPISSCYYVFMFSAVTIYRVCSTRHLHSNRGGSSSNSTSRRDDDDNGQSQGQLDPQDLDFGGFRTAHVLFFFFLSSR